MEKQDLDLIDGNSNPEFKVILNQKIQDMFWKILTYLEVSFPHKPGDGSENEKSYNAIRSKILRIGNDAIRSNDDLFKSFVTFKVYDYKLVRRDGVETQIFTFKNNWQGKGESNDQGRQDS